MGINKTIRLEVKSYNRLGVEENQTQLTDFKFVNPVIRKRQ